ncbi:MAG TPA: glycosyltransferase family 2 protein [Terriglobales bacterium]
MLEVQSPVRYSIAIPLYNERDSIMPLYQRLKEVMESAGKPFECVFVDDGSTDDSLALLREIALVDSRITVVGLRQNAGKSQALSAAFSVARGDFIVTMDGDLQHDPADIPRFVEKLEEGFDIVCGQRVCRREGLFQRISNRCANWVLASLTGLPIHDWGGGFKAYRRTLVSDVPIYGELQRLIPVLAFGRGIRVSEIPITVAPREHGVSKYGVIRKLPVFFDLLTVRFLLRYLSRPLHFFGTAGFLGVFAGSVIGLWLLVDRVIYGAHIMGEHGPLMIFSAVMIVSGVQLLALGLLAEIHVRYHFEGRSRTILEDAACLIRAHSQSSTNRESKASLSSS